MKRISLIALFLLAAASFAAAQIGAAPATDVLGAHLNYGRGCAGCHAPHSGAYGNGNAKTADSTSGSVALWGEDVASLYGKTITFGGFSPAGTKEVLPSSMTGAPDVSGLLTCLSCHDGNYATGAMMRNAVYETLPPTYGTYNTVPTLLSNASNGNSQGNYLNDHPVGLKATFSCNTPTGGATYGESGHNWDCALASSGGNFTLTAGPNMQTFINNYGFFVALGNNAGTPVVVCTTCHDQHLMNVVNVTNNSTLESTGGVPAPGSSGATVASGLSGLPAGNYATMFFIRAPYNPANGYAGGGKGSAGSNQTAQFCRQCHGGESNEMNGGTAGTTF